MRKTIISFILLLITFWCYGQNKEKNKKVIVAYVTSWTNPIPNPKYITHINYAFGHVTETFDGVRIDNPERLKK